ncbi:MAG TPA: HAMP domain-containing sensor histidine kinase [Trebonia sp.]|jgi:signal transduction histidine kinase|nr:HAMP domain-containing sensor histidine kinase [Trebonia sp.]
MISAQVQVVLIAAGCTGAVGTIGIGAIRLLRRASLRLSLQAAAAIAVLAVVAGTLGTANAMFISHHDLGVVGIVCVVAGLVAFGFSWLLGRQIEIGSLALRKAARSLGHEEAGFTAPDGPMAAELAALSRELAATAVKLRRSRERERRMERSRRELVAWVSHDLRAPLAGLRAMAEALEDGIAADTGRYHRQIRAEVTRLSTMIDDLFELSRIESGTLTLALDDIAIGDLVGDMVARMEAVARARGVRLTAEADGVRLTAEADGADADDDDTLVTRADPRELSRALGNLLDNAIRHTPAGGDVRVTATPDNGDVLVTVADGCGGIPDADLGSVFDLAWRGSSARTPGTDGGAGLGLAIVRGIVEAHHGRVSVANTCGGCEFAMRLPAIRPDDTEYGETDIPATMSEKVPAP